MERGEYGTLVIDTHSTTTDLDLMMYPLRSFTGHIERNGRTVRTVSITMAVNKYRSPRDQAYEESEKFKEGAEQILRESMIKMPTWYRAEPRKTDFGWCKVDWRDGQ
jgi:hypothetical protein